MSRSAVRVVVCIAVIATGCAGRSDTSESGPTSDTIPVPYGTQDEADVTGAVTSVPVDESDHLHDVLDMLRGHVAGLQVAELPNGDIRLRIRGSSQSLRADDASNQPLLVIDDMPVQPRAIRLALKGLNPRDVESITVLKDVGSTAIYGTRGANGVILIRLKR